MATTTRRTYIVIDTKTKTPRLIKAAHPSHAIRHVAEARYTAAVATQDQLIELLGKGIPVETITAEQQELPTASAHGDSEEAEA